MKLKLAHQTGRQAAEGRSTIQFLQPISATNRMVVNRHDPSVHPGKRLGDNGLNLKCSGIPLLTPPYKSGKGGLNRGVVLARGLNYKEMRRKSF